MTHHDQMLDEEARWARVVQLLTSYQRDIHVFVRSLVIDPDEAQEIVQDTNLVLWEKRAEFEAVKDVRAWIFRIARYKVLEHRAKRKRKCLCFSDTLIDQLALRAPQNAVVDNDLLHELRRCIAELSATDRKILNQRYSTLISCESIAKVAGRPIRWVYNTLNRIRQTLLDCVTRHADVRKKP
jgi:RNA polymerase sigma-70 factor, ECF subfamily